ncbi:hypothetical protein [Absidia glauca]|uniref:Transcription activator GCR1-like domain-containing protein n=2 Tax=Absidia glauca TaxID=4829 RepID=A0A163J8J2_ABSGL|nr:hypothetical protein [Absidia glauca]
MSNPSSSSSSLNNGASSSTNAHAIPSDMTDVLTNESGIYPDMATYTYALNRAQQEVGEEAASLRPVNTEKTYKNKQLEFLSWCEHLPEPAVSRSLVSGSKLNFFLQQKVRGRKHKRQADKVIKYPTVCLYAAAIIDLYHQQKRAGANSNDDPRPYIKDLLKTIRTQEFAASRANMDDRGEGTLADGYTTNDQVANVINFYWTRTSHHGEHLRGGLAFLLSHYLLLRGESIRKMELSDIQTVNLENEGVRSSIDCPALVMIMRQGKTNKNNRLDTAGCIRNARVEICPFMALGVYFFWRFHVENEPFPDLVASRNWYPVKVFKAGADSSTEWSYFSHKNSIHKALSFAGIKSKKKPHINRGSSARMADILGVNEDQIRRQGRWNNTTMNGAYLTTLPREMMRMMAGFPTSTKSFYLARAALDPPAALCKKVFPEADQWCDRLAANQQNPDNGDPIESTVAVDAFLKMIMVLRKTFLQDSVSMMQVQPNHPIWNHSLFSDPCYLEFKRALEQIEVRDHDPAHTLLQQCVPMIEQRLNDMQEYLSNKIDTQRVTSATTNDYITQLVTGRATLSLNVNNNDGTPSSLSTSSPPFQQQQTHSSQQQPLPQSSQQQPLPQSSLQQPPSYRMSRGIRTVNDLYREWNDGLAGGYSIISLEQRWGVKWRQDDKEKKFYNRRRSIIATIEKYAEEHNITMETAVNLAEENRSRRSKSLHYLAEHNDTIFD